MPAVNIFELGGVVFGVLYVLLAARGNSWCWLSGIFSALCYIVFAWQTTYYLDMVVQVYYVLAGGYGWYTWLQAHDKDATATFRAVAIGPKQLFTELLVTGALIVPAGLVVKQFGNAYPYLDAATTMFSFYATWLTIRKVLHSWLVWIAVDVVMAMQYALMGGYMTTGLYLFFAVMAVYGYLSWKKSIAAAPGASL